MLKTFNLKITFPTQFLAFYRRYREFNRLKFSEMSFKYEDLNRTKKPVMDTGKTKL